MKGTVVWIFLLILALGCGDGRPRTFPVRGKVLVDGEPLEGASEGAVRLIPVKGGRPVCGELNEKGEFVFSCYEKGDGCPLGEFYVEVFAIRIEGMKMWYLIPPRYWNPQANDWILTVEGKEENLLLETHWLPEEEKERKKPVWMNRQEKKG